MALTIDSTKSNIELEQRRQQALVTVKQCTKLLKDNFGATEVILFQNNNIK